jgi:hypothetical protein
MKQSGDLDTQSHIQNNDTDRPQTREALLEQCIDLARSQSILPELDSDLRKHGFAGPTNIPQIVFLATYTRMFPHPVSVVIKGPSSSGKSFALHAGLRYVPKSAYEEFHGLSEKALVYANKLKLKHRYLVIQEAAGLANGDGRTFLRQLLSEGQVRYMTVQNTKDGNVGQELPVIEGPIGLMMTTTANSLHWEDETRMLTLQVDQSAEQTKRALMAKLRGGPTYPSDDDLTRWYALHDFVVAGTQSVVIPYEEALLECMPSSHQRILRDAEQVLALIRAHTLLHQCTRDCENEQIIASLDDYAAVYQLIGEPLSQGLDKTVAPHIREVAETVKQLIPNSGTPISVTDLADALGKDVGVISRNVKAAVARGYLENQNPGQGHKAMLVPGGRELPTGTVLPSPGQLAARLNGDIDPTADPIENRVEIELPY